MQRRGNNFTDNITKGRLGEKLACCFLEKRGFKILDTNFFARIGEVDIVAESRPARQKPAVIYFIEVKTRSSYMFGTHEAITKFKLRKMLNASRLWLAGRPEFQSYHLQFAAVIVVLNLQKRVANISFLPILDNF